jgi:solute carrier family 26 (sodium-independent sulfate anion transporter), member 11
LVAGGFGIGTPSISIPREIAPVAPHRGGNQDDFATNEDYQPDDVEVGTKHDNFYGNSNAGDQINSADNVPLYAVETPFIHFDLTSAVRAAESSQGQVSFRQDIDEEKL